MGDDALTFGCGRTVQIETVFVRRSYDELLEGGYSELVNRRMIESRLDDARRIFPP